MVRWSMACSGNPGLGLTLTQFEAALRRQAAREAVTSAAANSRRMSSAGSGSGAGVAAPKASAGQITPRTNLSQL